jgi:glycosyltransferase involved in cell wall biosynthesis
MDEVKVSVCMVTYNQERYIAQAVESALAQQTAFPIEIIIGEDCSTDNTRALVVELAQRSPEIIRLRLAEKNQGAKRNFVGTYNECRGQYVTILEGDDYYTHPRKLQIQADALDAHPEWAICFHPARCLYEDGLRGPEIYPVDWARPEATIVDLLAANFMPTAGALFRNRLFPALPDWFLESDLGDWPLHILNAAHGKIGFLSDVMSVYRIHAGGVWSGRDLATNLTSVFKMLTAVDRHFDGQYSPLIEQNRLNTLCWLIRQLDDKRLMQGGDADALQSTCNRLVEENRSLLELKVKWEMLAEEHRSLQSFRDDWSASWSYRVERETRRFIRQLQGIAKQFRRRPAPTPSPSADSNSRAA